MIIERTERRVRTRDGLERLLRAIESGAEPKPDCIDLRGEARIDAVAPARRGPLLARIHGCVLRGFRSPAPAWSRRRRLALWRQIASSGFHDFSEDGWSKCYDTPYVHDYDYVGPYLEGGLDALDPYEIYSSVLGTHDYGVEDFCATALCDAVHTIVEPMAGTAEFSVHGHFRHPDFRYVMFDLDERAHEHVMARRWLPDTEHHYLVADVLDEAVWQQVKSLTSGESLCYIGKQSHHIFGPRQLLRLVHLATQHVDTFVLEVPPPTLMSQLPETDELTRPEMEDAGFQVALVDEPETRPNPITNRMAFRLDAWDARGRRTLFRYPGWTNWPLPTLAFMAEILDLRMKYFHSESHEFVPVDEGTETSDLEENVSFMAFTRHRR